MFKENHYIAQLEAYFPGDSLGKLRLAIEHAKFLYESLHRYSGETYFERCLRITVDKLTKYNPDQVSIIACLLTSAGYSPRCDMAKIEELFGAEVRGIVESLGKINNIKSRYSTSDTMLIRQMFLTLAYDVRTILLRLLERIENLETLSFKTPEKRKANAKEILDVYVPISSRLGLYDITTQLEDMAFEYIYPLEYQELKKEVEAYLSLSKSSMEEVKKQLQEVVKEMGLNADVTGRIKHLFSIFKKLKKKNATLDEIYDIYAMRIVLKSQQPNAKIDDKETLYAIMGELTRRYVSLQDRFKDYLAKPKENGYQSIHIAIVGLHSDDAKKPTEVQIRTDRMHEMAEFGLAAHWLYKSKKAVEDEEVMQLLNNLRRSLAKSPNLSEEVFNNNIQVDRIFVMTPENLVKDLPESATPIDFAYALDSDLGHACVSCKVNGLVKPLDYRLRNGDVVEIITSNRPNPKLSWLGFVMTQNARNRIKYYYSSLENEDLFDSGVSEMNLLLAQLKFPLLNENLDFLSNYHGKQLSYEERHELIEDIGAQVIAPSEVFEGAYGKAPELVLYGERQKEQENRFKILQAGLRGEKNGNAKSLLIGGEENIPYKLSTCCRPLLEDDLVAYVTKNSGVSVHKKICKFVKSASPSRMLDVVLLTNKHDVVLKKYQVMLLLELSERKNFLRDLIELFDRHSVTVLEYTLLKKIAEVVYRRVIIDVNGEEELAALMTEIEVLNGVLKVSRV